MTELEPRVDVASLIQLREEGIAGRADAEDLRVAQVEEGISEIVGEILQTLPDSLKARAESGFSTAQLFSLANGEGGYHQHRDLGEGNYEFESPSLQRLWDSIGQQGLIPSVESFSWVDPDYCRGWWVCASVPESGEGS